MDTTKLTDNQPSKAAMDFAHQAVGIYDGNKDMLALTIGLSIVYSAPRTPDEKATMEGRGQEFITTIARLLDRFAAPHIAEATARREEAATAELTAATLRGEVDTLRRQLEAAEGMAKAIRMTKGEVDYDPFYEDGMGNTYTAYAMDTDYYHNMMGALRKWDEVSVPSLAPYEAPALTVSVPFADGVIETHEEGQG